VGPDARVRPYGAVGIAITNATYELTYDDSGDEYTSEINGSSTGLAFGGGVVFALAPRFTLGADLRINTASVELEGEDLFGDPVTFDTKTGGTTFALTAGFRF
jgi:opacity protein-like surface antigen